MQVNVWPFEQTGKPLEQNTTLPEDELDEELDEEPDEEPEEEEPPPEELDGQFNGPK